MGVFNRRVRRTSMPTPMPMPTPTPAPVDHSLGSAITEQFTAVRPADQPADLPADRPADLPVPVRVPAPVPAMGAARVRRAPVREVPAPRACGQGGAGGFAVLGVLATGPSPSRDRLVEVAVVQLDAAGALVREWTTLLSSPQALHPAARHGVDPEELWGAPTFDAVAAELLALLAGRVVTAHGAAGALAFLRAELARAGVALPLLAPLCTLDAGWHHLPSLGRRRLSDCCAAAGVPVHDDPTALHDARATAGLLRHFLTGRALRTDASLGRLTPRAATAAWPTSTAHRADPRPRRLPPVHLPEAPRPPLAALAGRLELDGAGLPLPAAATYAELLVELIATRPAGERCAQALSAVADVAALSPAQVGLTHQRVLAALAAQVVPAEGAGQAGPDAERRELLSWAGVLGVETDLVAVPVLVPVPVRPSAPVRASAPAEHVVIDLRNAPAPAGSGRRVPRQSSASTPTPASRSVVPS